MHKTGNTTLFDRPPVGMQRGYPKHRMMTYMTSNTDLVRQHCIFLLFLCACRLYPGYNHSYFDDGHDSILVCEKSPASMKNANISRHVAPFLLCSFQHKFQGLFDCQLSVRQQHTEHTKVQVCSRGQGLVRGCHNLWNLWPIPT